VRPILVACGIDIDFVAQVERLPCPGETAAGINFETHNGGKEANRAHAIARLGYSVSLMGALGNDVFGDRLLGGLESVGVDCTAVKRFADTSSWLTGARPWRPRPTRMPPPAYR